MNNLDFSNPVVVAVICAVVLIIVLAVVWVVTRQRQRRKTEELRARFGSEYDLALREYGSRSKAFAPLVERVHRVNRKTIRPLTEPQREHFLAEWEGVQAR